VDSFRSGNLSCLTPCNMDSQVIAVASRPANIRDVWGAHCDDGGVMVLFLINSDVPLLHTGYIFEGYGEGSSCNKVPIKPESKLYIRPIIGQWYHFSD
jgi:hypothetical protein